ncbi:hypothetical protein Thermus72351_23590 [Thermus brockianus]
MHGSGGEKATPEEERAEGNCALVERAVDTGNCFVVEAHQQVVGYAVLEYTFYAQGFISLLYIHPNYRGQGVGTMLVRYLESVCQTPKLFTSTNLSNVAMQGLLVKLGYMLSGVIHHLDQGDPELVFVKALR